MMDQCMPNATWLPRSRPGLRAPWGSQEMPRSPKSQKKAAPELPPERPVQGCACDSGAHCQSIHAIVSPNSLFWDNETRRCSLAAAVEEEAPSVG
jgi:hypothetical protein